MRGKKKEGTYFRAFEISYRRRNDETAELIAGKHTTTAISQRRALSSFWVTIAAESPETLAVEITGITERDL